MNNQVIVRIKEGVVNAGKQGILYTTFFDQNGMEWAAVTLDGEEDPCLLKLYCLEFKKEMWVDSNQCKNGMGILES